jgi:hypothetical protein
MIAGDMTDSESKPDIASVPTHRQPTPLSSVRYDLKPIDDTPAADASGLLEIAVSAMLRSGSILATQEARVGALPIQP